MNPSAADPLGRRPARPDEVEERFAASVAELKAALDRLKRRDESAYRPLVTELRLLVGSGQGNSLLFRIAERRQRSLPDVLQSTSPDHLPDPAVITRFVRFGNSIYHRTEGPPPGSQRTAFDSALDSTVFEISANAGVTATLTWRDCIHKVAETMALHVDDSTPVRLDRLDRLFLVNGRPWGYRTVLRRLAEVVTRLATDLDQPPSP